MAVSQSSKLSKKVPANRLHNINMKIHKVGSLIKELEASQKTLQKMRKEEEHLRRASSKMNSKVSHLAKGSRTPALDAAQVKKIAAPVRAILREIENNRPEDQSYKDGISTALLAITFVMGQAKRADISLVAQAVAPKGNTWGLRSCNWQLDTITKKSFVKKPGYYGGKYSILAAGKAELEAKLGRKLTAKMAQVG